MAGRFRGISSVPDVTRVRGDGTATQTQDSLEERVKARVAKHSAYEKYKSQLHEFFDGKRDLPQHMRDMLATRPGAEEHGFASEDGEAEVDAATRDDVDGAGKKRKRKKKKGPPEKAPPGTRRRVVSVSETHRNHIDALRESKSPREAEQAIDALRSAGFPLPLEVDLLSKALGHKDEAVVVEALRGLTKLVDGPEMRGASLLKGRLQGVALVASTSEVRDLCSELQATLSR